MPSATSLAILIVRTISLEKYSSWVEDTDRYLRLTDLPSFVTVLTYGDSSDDGRTVFRLKLLGSVRQYRRTVSNVMNNSANAWFRS